MLILTEKLKLEIMLWSYIFVRVYGLVGAPPKHRVLEHQQQKDQLLLHRLSKTSTVNNVEYRNIECSFALKHCDQRECNHSVYVIKTL